MAKKKPLATTTTSEAKNKSKDKSSPAKYPRHSVDKALRIPKAILDQNAGKACMVKESAEFLGVGAAGPYTVEVSSGLKYGFLDRPTPGQIVVTERAKRVLRPQDAQDELDGIREAVVNAPVIATFMDITEAKIFLIRNSFIMPWWIRSGFRKTKPRSSRKYSSPPFKPHNCSPSMIIKCV